jgi:hypothetical protein
LCSVSDMASGRVSSRRVPESESSIAYVQMDGLVNIMRISVNIIVLKKCYFYTQVCIFVSSMVMSFSVPYEDDKAQSRRIDGKHGSCTRSSVRFGC